MNQGALDVVLVALANSIEGQPVLAVNGGGQATFKTTVVPSGGIVFRLNGQKYLKADLSAQVLTGFNLATTAALQWACLRVELNKNGTVSIKQSGMFLGAAEAQANPPTRSAAMVTVGLIIQPPSFIPGTTALDAGDVDFIDGDPDLAFLNLPG
jgi:hypothetical protein